MPFWWIILLLIWRIFSKSVAIKKRLGIAIISVVIVFTNPFLFCLLVNKWQPAPVIISNASKYEAGIVLGGLSGFDKYEKGHFNGSADRFIQTANLYHKGIIKKVIITGGTGKLRQNEPAEAFFLRDEFIANGVKPNDIIIEAHSKNTYENAVFTKKIIDSLNIKPPFILITSALHMTRSIRTFRKAGYDFIAFPCDYKVQQKNFEIEYSLIPDVAYLNYWYEFLREVVGLAAYRLTGKA